MPVALPDALFPLALLAVAALLVRAHLRRLPGAPAPPPAGPKHDRA